MRPLLDAAIMKDTKRLRKLLQAGEDASHSDPNGQTALHLAAQVGSAKGVACCWNMLVLLKPEAEGQRFGTRT
jgi:ankyrin repeat protein